MIVSKVTFFEATQIGPNISGLCDTDKIYNFFAPQFLL